MVAKLTGLLSCTGDSVGLIVWSNAEMAITLICIGIPVCRPLYRRIFSNMSSSRSTGYQKQGPSNDNHSSIALRTIGGGAVDRDGQFVSSKRNDTRPKDSESETSLNEVKIGVNGPFTRTKVGTGRRDSIRDDTSAEGILEAEYRSGQEDGERDGGDYRKGQITVTETVRVERS